MADEWYCQVEGEQCGPMSPQALKALVGKGAVSPEDLVRCGKSGKWVPASRVKGLFPARTSSAFGADAGSGSQASSSQTPSTSSRPKRILRAKAVEAEDSDSSLSISPPSDDEISAPPPASGSRRARPAGDTPPPAPPSKSKAPPAGGEATFGFLEDAYDSPPRPATASKTTHGDLDKKRKLDPGLVWMLLALLVVLALVTIVLFVVTQMGDSKPEREAAKAAAEAKAGAGVAKKDESKGEAEDSKKDGKEAAKSVEGTWLDMSKPSPPIGGMTVQIMSAELGKPRTKESRTKTEYLILRVKVSNGNDTKKVDYVSWNASSAAVKLVDNFDNEYGLVAGSTQFEGQLTKAPIRPGESAEDILIFEPPVKKAKTLKLRLPASAFKEKEVIPFEIPMTKVVPAKEDAAGASASDSSTAEAAAAEKPAEKREVAAPLTPPTMPSYSSAAADAPAAASPASVIPRANPKQADPDIPPLEIDAKDAEGLPPRL